MNLHWGDLRERALGENMFEACLLLSLFLHMAAGIGSSIILHWNLRSQPVIEVDLTAPFRPRQPWDLRAPGASKGERAKAPIKMGGGKRSSPDQKPTMLPAIAPVAPRAPAPPEKDWVLPGPNTKELIKPTLPSAPPTPPAPIGAAPEGTGEGGEAGKGGSGGGTGTGEAMVNRPPRLLNIDEIRAGLRRYYPEAERRAGREGQAVVRLIVNDRGRVEDVDILHSAGEAFDQAAKKVGMLMRFEPALVGSVPTAVKVKQLIVFQLRD